MKARTNLIPRRFLPLSAVIALAWAIPSESVARLETEVARIPIEASICERPAFVVAGGNGAGLTSLDGMTWISNAVMVTTNWRSQCRGKGVLVRVGHDGSLLTSSDGTNWTSRDVRVPFALHRVAYGSGRFVAVGNEGAVISSDDAITWKPQDSGTDERLRGVAYGNGLFVAVGYAGTILMSRDGTSWKQCRSPTDTRLLDVAFGNGTFVAVGWHGWILTSTDGLRWRRIHSGTMSHLCRVAFGGDSILERTAARSPCRSGLRSIQRALVWSTCCRPTPSSRMRNCRAQQIWGSKPDISIPHAQRNNSRPSGLNT